MAKRKRDITVSFRATQAERDLIENQRKLTGLTMHDFMLACLKKKRIHVKPGAALVTVQLKKIGNNLNQLTRHVNSGFLPDECRDILADIRDEIAEVRRSWQ